MKQPMVDWIYSDNHSDNNNFAMFCQMSVNCVNLYVGNIQVKPSISRLASINTDPKSNLKSQSIVSPLMLAATRNACTSLTKHYTS